MTKKKTNRQKRTLIGAVCVAAVIMAGSTFAWFTSTDEVTNRLTASADYGVSIVESFTPPKQWVPGQEVNKDVYATNTGNIPAFVEEIISGKLTITYENLVNTFGVTDVTYEEISGDEVTAKEAGGHLVWTNAAGVDIGDVNVKLDLDATGPTTKWKPTVDGTYIYRRAITPQDIEHPGNEKYTLEGYHYADGKYYKIKIAGNDSSNGEMTARELFTVDENGVLTTAPTIQFYTLKTITNEDAVFNYNSTDNYLEATYATPATADDTYDATAAAARLEVEKANIAAAYLGPKAVYDLGAAQLAAINSAIQEAELVKAAAQAYLDANTEATTANATLSNARTAINAFNLTDNALDLPATTALSISDDDIDNSTLDGSIDDSSTPKGKLKAYVTAYNTALGNYNTAKTNLETAVETLKSNAASGDKTTIDANYNTVKNALTAAQTAADNLYKACGAIVTSTVNSGLDAENATANSLKTSLETWKALAKADTDVNTTLQGLITTFDDAYDAVNDATTGTAADLNTKKEAYITAKGNYNTNINGTVRTAYSTATSTFDTNKLTNVLTKSLTAKEFDNVISAYKITSGDVTSITSGADLVTAATADKGYDKTAPEESTYTPVESYKINATTDTADATMADLLAEMTSKQTVYEETFGTGEGGAAAAAAAAQAAANADKTIKIRIYLDDAVKNNSTWVQLPTTTNATAAYFYLNKILGAGETSERLVDKVVLDPATQNGTFVDLTFDLNVALKSAQVTYDDNNNIVVSAANETLDANVAVTDATDINTALTWTAKVTP